MAGESGTTSTPSAGVSPVITPRMRCSIASSSAALSSSSWTAAGSGVSTVVTTGCASGARVVDAAASAAAFARRRFWRRLRRRLKRRRPKPLRVPSSSLRAARASASKEPVSAVSGSGPRSLSCSLETRLPIVLPTTTSAAFVVAPASVAPAPTVPGIGFMRLSSSLACMNSVTAPTTLSVGQGDLGWCGAGQAAPVISVEYLNRLADFSRSSTLSLWSFS
mmetsp:Transcript_205/g.511  ORF Transcript_205/g.511 Transcript_205/m.511 type:complete len:221 (-) Transcript_205:542-1204(-)